MTTAERRNRIVALAEELRHYQNLQELICNSYPQPKVYVDIAIARNSGGEYKRLDASALFPCDRDRLKILIAAHVEKIREELKGLL